MTFDKLIDTIKANIIPILVHNIIVLLVGSVSMYFFHKVILFNIGFVLRCPNCNHSFSSFHYFTFNGFPIVDKKIRFSYIFVSDTYMT